MFARLSLESELVAGSAAGSATGLSAAGSVGTLGSSWVVVLGVGAACGGATGSARVAAADSAGRSSAWIVVEVFPEPEWVLSLERERAAAGGAFISSSSKKNSAWVVVEPSQEWHQGRRVGG